MGQVVLSGNPPIEISLKRSARARRLSLRVSRLDGQVTLSLPRWTGQAEAIAFVREKEPWLRQTLSSQPAPTVPRPGGTLLFEGRELAIVAGQGRAVRLRDDVLEVPGPEDRAPVRIRAFLKLAAQERLGVATDRYAAMVGRKVARISLRDTRSRWGSCTADAGLMFSWRLVMAPPSVLDYVAAHEVAHLVEMNHSPAYWAVVRGIYPDYERQRRWLRRNGATLHAVRFGD